MAQEHCMFTSGWLDAVERYERGATWTAIRDVAETKPEKFGAGMKAAADALEGMFYTARQMAREAGLTEALTEELIRRSLDA